MRGIVCVGGDYRCGNCPWIGFEDELVVESGQYNTARILQCPECKSSDIEETGNKHS